MKIAAAVQQYPAGSFVYTFMQAAVYRHYGAPEVVLRCEDVEKPTPGDDEVLIKVRAAAVNPLDSHLMKGTPYVARLMFGLTVCFRQACMN